MQVERPRHPLHAGILGRLAGARDIQKKYRQREVKMLQLELKNSTVLLLWRRPLGTGAPDVKANHINLKEKVFGVAIRRPNRPQGKMAADSAANPKLTRGMEHPG
jgi:hypothetical protein